MTHLQRMEFLNIENWVRPRIDLSAQIKMLFSFVMHSDLIGIKKNAWNFYSTMGLIIYLVEKKKDLQSFFHKRNE